MNSLNMTSCCNFDSSQGKVSPDLGEEQNASNVDLANDSILNRNRKPTDVTFLVAFVLYFAILVCLVSYCMHYGDIYRIVNGYDNCGNVCGRINVFHYNDICNGMNMTDKKYLRDHECVKNCSDYRGYYNVMNRCIQFPTEMKDADTVKFQSTIKDFFQEVAEDLHNTWKDILYMCLIAFVFSVVTLFMFKYLADFIVWIVLVGSSVVLFTTTTLTWIHYKKDLQDFPDDPKGQHNMYLALAILLTIATVILIWFMVFLRKRIQLVIILFKEAGKAASKMPLLLFEPILTSFITSMVIALWLYSALWIESSGELSIQNFKAYFVKDGTMKLTRWFNLMGLYWATQFLVGCQHMAIAGAVATWYFTRNKNQLDSPIVTSFKNLFQYHMGTVALGSLIIAIIKIVRSLLGISKGERKQCEDSCECCLGSCKSFLQYINRNAYIETAIYGDSFLEAGSKAFHKLSSNALRVFTINTIGDFVLFLGKMFVIAITILFGMEQLRSKEELHHMWVPLILAGIFAYIISNCFITVYEMIIDTIFLCFCEDCEINDGINSPYYMSTSLMEFVDHSKKILGINNVN